MAAKEYPVTPNWRVTQEMFDEIKEHAEARGVSASSLVRRALQDYLNRLIPTSEIRFTYTDEELEAKSLADYQRGLLS